MLVEWVAWCGVCVRDSHTMTVRLIAETLRLVSLVVTGWNAMRMVQVFRSLRITSLGFLELHGR